MTKKRILVIEDHEDTREVMCMFLRHTGLLIHTVASLKEARAAIASEKYDLLLLDCILPDGSGLDFCQEIRQIDQQMPILCYSGKAYDADRVAALRAGVSAYLVKPTDLDILVETIERLLNESS